MVSVVDLLYTFMEEDKEAGHMYVKMGLFSLIERVMREGFGDITQYVVNALSILA